MKSLQEFAVKALSRYRFVFIFYTVIGLLVFGKLFFMKGAILGGDWGLPTTHDQVDHGFYSSLFAWTDSGNIFGTRQFSQMSIIFNSFLKALSWIGIDSAMVPKLFLIFVFSLGASNMNLYLRTKSIKSWIALVGGALYVMTPVFFDYSLMGWIFVLLSIALLPLLVVSFEKYLERGNWRDGLIAIMVFSLAILQSQSLIWYPLVLIFLTFTNSKDFIDLKKHLIRFFYVMAGFLLVNSYWLVGSLLLPDKFLFDSSIVSSTISFGTSARLSAENILRLWGGLFNYQFESSFPATLIPVTYILPLLAIFAGIFYKTRKSMIIFLFLLYLVPFVMFKIDRQFLASIPFSALIRDVARFAVLSSFGAIGLLSITLNELNQQKKYSRWILSLSLVFIFLSISPFWLGRLYGFRKSDSDFKFRTYQWPAEYLELEDKLSKESDDQKALFLPMGGIVSSTSDLRFNGAYQEMQDLSAGFSKVPGVISASDKSSGTSSYLIGQIKEAINDGDMSSLNEIIDHTNVTFVILRKDIEMGEKNRASLLAYMQQMVDAGRAEPYLNSGNILAIRFKKQASDIAVYDSYYEVSDITANVVNNRFPESAKDIREYLDGLFVKDITPFFGLAGPKTGITLEAQNVAYSNAQIPQTANQILPFLSSEELEKISILKKLRKRQFSSANSSDHIKREYLTFASGDVPKATLYFSCQDSSQHSAKLNGKEIFLQREEAQNNYCTSEVSLQKGLNAIDSDDSVPLAAMITRANGNKNVSTQVSYTKINPTKYKVSIKDASKKMMLELRESYNSYWVVYPANNGKDRFKLNPDGYGTSNHLVGNGYSNLFQLNTDTGDNIELVIEFWPQRIFYLLSLISSLSLLIFIIISFFSKNETKS